MDHIFRRLGMYFFIIGLLLAVFAGVFKMSPGMLPVLYVVLIFSGVFSGLLNITFDEEHHFLVAATGLVVFALAFNVLFSADPLLSGFIPFLRIFSIFVGSMLASVGVRVVVEFAAQSDFDYVQRADFRAEEIESLVLSKNEKFWSLTVFIAICMTFIILLLEFFNLNNGFLSLIVILNWLITIVFIIDLFVLYKKEIGFISFLKNCWPDIIASIPFASALQVLKLIRLVRMVKLIKVAKVGKTAKFFSKKTSASHYIDKSSMSDKVLRDEGNSKIRLYSKNKTSKKK